MKTITLPLDIQPIEEGGYHCFVDTKVNGEPARMLIDTGASRTVFHLQFLKNMDGFEFELNEIAATGLGSGELENFITTIPHFALQDLEIREHMVNVLDLQIVNTGYQKLGLPAIAGIIGCDLLVKYSAVMDLKKKELKLRKK